VTGFPYLLHFGTYIQKLECATAQAIRCLASHHGRGGEKEGEEPQQQKEMNI
jgi:hypothetical protein